MKNVILLGLDKVDVDSTLSFFCKGIVLSLLGYHVDVFYDEKTEHISSKKADLIRKAFTNVILHPFDTNLPDDINEYINNAEIIIINPMPYSEPLFEYVYKTGKHVYFDLAGLENYKKDITPFGKYGYLVYLDSQGIELSMNDMMSEITKSNATYACTFDLSGSVFGLQSDGKSEYMTLFVEPTTGNFFFLASVYFAGLIYSLEHDYNLIESMRIATVLADIIVKNGSDSIQMVTEDTLRTKYEEEFGNIDEKD